MRPAFEEFPDSAIGGLYCAINSGFARGEGDVRQTEANRSISELSYPRINDWNGKAFKVGYVARCKSRVACEGDACDHRIAKFHGSSLFLTRCHQFGIVFRCGRVEGGHPPPDIIV